jgi:nitrate/nitrite transporter NarK
MKWFLACMLVFNLIVLAFVVAVPVMAQVPAGYRTRAQINACTLQGCQSQTWFLRNSAWCGKTADGWSPTQGVGKLSVTCRRPI